ncbi:hypothetical protein [Polymorphospora rubra]|uniref:hypothetical protein n=1 Tax=Polymorphospora rubra TaxID=338584 RepID=UPI00341155BC
MLGNQTEGATWTASCCCGFPEVRRNLGRNRLVELGEQMTAARSKAPADPLALMSAKA